VPLARPRASLPSDGTHRRVGLQRGRVNSHRLALHQSLVSKHFQNPKEHCGASPDPSIVASARSMTVCLYRTVKLCHTRKKRSSRWLQTSRRRNSRSLRACSILVITGATDMEWFLAKVAISSFRSGRSAPWISRKVARKSGGQR